MTAPDRPESPATVPKAVGTHPKPVDGDMGGYEPLGNTKTHGEPGSAVPRYVDGIGERPHCTLHGAMLRVSPDRYWYRCATCNIGVEDSVRSAGSNGDSVWLTTPMPDPYEEARRHTAMLNDEYPNARDCEHGSLRRTCQTCDLLDQVRTLTEERDEALRQVDLWRTRLANHLAVTEDDPK